MDHFGPRHYTIKSTVVATEIKRAGNGFGDLPCKKSVKVPLKIVCFEIIQKKFIHQISLLHYSFFTWLVIGHNSVINDSYIVCPGGSDPPEKNILIYLNKEIWFIPFFYYSF